MSALTKIAGIAAGLSAVAVFGVAVAQSEPPNPYITNPAIGAGQQSTHMTPMGETGVLTHENDVRTATLIREPEVAVAPAPEPAAPAAQEPVAVAPAAEPAPATTAMGAAPEPQQSEAAPQKVARADRN
ncbi:hypothetical protein [Caenimonas aquaedulcis]|uniref:Uncharacterized protein n=1 Tax=Caenimonas aquaedulcis TaxID=2793270 RepID=A0A931H3A4_9BURK|nr:hypothetical protein [Caenimonas aquaedulcis]MBG9387790.1 hypothetical protein [Caenimonas aquaedulcis]